ncbi:NAD(P)-dependent oxidoreductase [Amycolatopsis sp. cmx-11-32]|uniref:NAD(P)-dependent oxidoreductase n=1 Tax=Amycolatopsis sp. cmx-11-32 TaxID=2785796 RepID=UPI0039E39CB6
MAKLVVFGGTGYAGTKVVAEARDRGHEVLAIARNAEGEGTRAGSLYDEAFLAEVAKGADVLVIAVQGQSGLLEAVPSIAQVAKDNGARIGVVGGAGSLYVTEGGPRLIDTPEFPDEYKGEAGAHVEVLEAFRALPEDVEWFYLSPAPEFGAWTEGGRIGDFRLGSDVILNDENGRSKISGADYAIAFVDEIDKPEHRRQRFCVAY